ncbi:MAG: TlpA family protein disulfide reductase [Bacteroidetes bacterium]|nr:TlpA family protein disulfide reductase [Bacteroidota bacterium]
MQIRLSLLACFLVCFACMPQAQEIKKIKIADLASYIQKSDHPLVVNFWATYCAPCNKEIPYFEKVVNENKLHHVELLLVSLDLPSYYPEKIVSFIKAQQYTASVWWLNETNADYFCPKVDKNWTGGIPSTLFLNNKTHYRKFFERQLTEPQVVENINALLKE